MKALEDKIEKLSGTNMALTDSLRAMQKESAHARDNRDENNSSKDDTDEDNSLMLFTAQNVCVSGHLSHLMYSTDRCKQITVTGRSNPDMA